MDTLQVKSSKFFDDIMNGLIAIFFNHDYKICSWLYGAYEKKECYNDLRGQWYYTVAHIMLSGNIFEKL